MVGGGGLVAMLCPTLVIPQTVLHQTPLSMGFSRQEYWNSSPFLTLGDLPGPGMESASLASPALAGDSLCLPHLGSPSRFYLILNLFSIFLIVTCFRSITYIGFK